MASPIAKLSILIPVYNEFRTLASLLDAVIAAPLPCEREIVVVDDCSTDGSRDVLAEYESKYPCIRAILHERNQGKGAAIRTALNQCTGDWAVIQDADLEYNPGDYAALLLPVQEGLADAVFGSRFLVGRYARAMFFWHNLANRFLTLVTNILCDLNLTDMETCYKLVRADILKDLTIRSNGFDLEPELTVKLARWGARIYEVPISYRGRTYAEGKKIGARDAAQALWALIRYRFFDPRYCKDDGFIILQSVRRAKHFNRWLFSQFEQYLGDEVLEAGCGIGNLTELVLDRKRLVGIDTNHSYIDRLQSAYGHLRNTTFAPADLASLESLKAASDSPFDSVFCINVLEHIEDDLNVLANFREMLKPGGRVIILVPNNPALYSGVDRVLGHVRRYTEDELRQRLLCSGFDVLSCNGFNRLGGFGWRVSGKILRKESLGGGQMRAFELLMPLARLLERIPFHCHNSLIAIGRKPG